MFSPTILLNGQVKGLWKRQIKKDSVTITPEPFVELTTRETAALETTAQEYGHFLGKSAKLHQD